MHNNICPEIREYHKILCNGDYPYFINKYLDTPELKRISYISYFCVGQYCKTHNVKCFYSRLDHSISCALIVWNLTKSKANTLTALFHDIGTPTFSHVVDFLLNDQEAQTSSEKNFINILKKSSNICKMLSVDGVTIDDIEVSYSYGVVENSSPKICADRLDAVFVIATLWKKYWKLDDVKNLYSKVVIIKNENGEDEIGFVDVLTAEKFFDGAFIYSLAFQESEDKYAMQFMADCIKLLLDKNIICMADLYQKKEKDIMYIVENNINCFNVFINLETVEKSNLKPDLYNVYVSVKRRYVIPLCNFNGIVKRLNKVSKKCDKKLNYILKYNEPKYAFATSIKEIKLSHWGCEL